MSKTLSTQDVKFLSPKEVHIGRDRWGRMVADIGGKEYTEIGITLAFPFTAADNFLILRDAEEGELGIIKDYKRLDKDSLKILNEELPKVYFIPKITRINTLKGERGGLLSFDVITEKGPRTFEVRSREHLQVLPGRRVILQDVDANRYEIEDLNKLDRHSQSLAYEYI